MCMTGVGGGRSVSSKRCRASKRCQDDLCLHHCEVRADADARPCAKWHVQVAMPCVFTAAVREVIGIELVWPVPPHLVPVERIDCQEHDLVPANLRARPAHRPASAALRARKADRRVQPHCFVQHLPDVGQVCCRSSAVAGRSPNTAFAWSRACSCRFGWLASRYSAQPRASAVVSCPATMKNCMLCSRSCDVHLAPRNSGLPLSACDPADRPSRRCARYRCGRASIASVDHGVHRLHCTPSQKCSRPRYPVRHLKEVEDRRLCPPFRNSAGSLRRRPRRRNDRAPTSATSQITSNVAESISPTSLMFRPARSAEFAARSAVFGHEREPMRIHIALRERPAPRCDVASASRHPRP